MPLSDPVVYRDKREDWLTAFRALRVAALRPLVTAALIAEHRANPRGPHSAELQLILNFVRGPALPMDGKAFAYHTGEGSFHLGEMAARGTPTTVLDEQVFATEEAAQHAAFLRRLAVVGLLAAPAGDPA